MKKVTFCDVLAFEILKLFYNKNFNKITICPSFLKVKDYMNIFFQLEIFKKVPS